MKKLLMASCAMGIGMLTTGVAFAQTAAPGSVTVRLNGRVNWYAGVESSSLDSVDGTKTATDSFYGYMRLYPGFDGVAANGLHYGAATQIRTDWGSSASSETLYVFQAYGYLGLPEIGQVSFGQQNGPTVLFETGTFEGFNDGGWWGDLPVIVPNNAEAVYPFVDNSNFDQTTNKFVYLSPVLSGFQFAVGFTPNQTAENYSPAATSVTSAVSGGTPRNLIDIGGQYTQTFGGFGIQLGADYNHAGQVSGTGAQTESFTTPSGYKNLSIFSGGATVTYAGVTVGGNTVLGNFNQVSGYTFQLEPNGGQAAIGWLAGAQYSAGPLTIGASYFQFNTTGDLPGGIDAGSGATITADGLTTGQQSNLGFAAGATYTLVPGVNLFLDYDYGQRHQGGFDFASNLAGTEHNNVRAQLFGVGTQIQW